MSFASFGPNRFNSNAGRSMFSDHVGTIRYPSPFFDVSHTYLPSSFKTMLRWCRYYFLTNPLINAVVYKMSEYPVTDLIFDSDNQILIDKWRKFFKKQLSFKKFQVEAGLDYNCYGNAFISINYPFRKFLTCQRCGKSELVNKIDYTFKSFKFHGECSACGHYGEFRADDRYLKSYKDIRLIRWDPEQISIRHNDATGESDYYYNIPGTLRNDLQMGKKKIIEKTPQTFLEAIQKNKALLFNKKNIFHMKRPTIAQKDKGWGLPMILPVLKDVFYLQILRKAQEAIAIEHVVPLRVLFPQIASGSSDPYATVNLSNWKRKVENEILRWRLDNNYIPVMPIPIGQQTLGAQGRALMLSQEYRVWAEHIVAGMGVPNEFIFGGLSYSGSNVSLRMLENHFLDYKDDHLDLAEWIIEEVGAFMGWEPVKVHFRRFKMADDLQRSAFNLQLNQAGKISDDSLLEDTDWDATEERQKIYDEQQMSSQNQREQALTQAQIQGEVQLQGLKYQNRAQKIMGQMTPPADPAQMQGMTGVPGQMSPQAMGQMQTEQGGMQTAMGMTPPIDPSQMMAQQGSPGDGGMPPGVGSQLGEGQQMGVDPAQAQQSPGVLELPALVQRIAAQLDQMSDGEKQPLIEEMKANNPQLWSLVQVALQERQGAHQSSAQMKKPEQKSPRRGPEATAA